MNWKTFKDQVESMLLSKNCENPDFAEIEGIDFKVITLASGITLKTNKIEILSYYKEKNSFYIVS